MNWIQKYQLGKSLNKRIYNAIDPTEGYPTLLGLGKHALNIGLGTEVKKMDEPVADAAWRKRLKLNYDKNLLPGNPDGSVRLPKSYENQFMVDTVGVKKRIKDIIGMYGSEEELKKYDADAEAFLRKDREYLDKLRHMYKGNKIVVNEFDVWKGRDPIPKGISPFSLMQNFTLEYNPRTKRVSYYDVYDFNNFESFVPGKPFTISGIIPKRQFGGNIFSRWNKFLQPTDMSKGYAIPSRIPSTELAISIGGEGGEPAYLIPSFKNSKLLKDPIGEFMKTGQHLGGPFSTWQEADKWERDIRHPYVEKGQKIPSPLRTWGKNITLKQGGKWKKILK